MEAPHQQKLKSKYICFNFSKLFLTSKFQNRLFEEEIKTHQENAAKKWGFDFRNGTPTQSATYSWERVVVPEIVPEMYTLTRAAHVREIITEPPTEQDILMDERFSKENSLDEMLNFPFKTPSSPSRQSSSTSPSRVILSCHKSLGKRQPRITGKFKSLNNNFIYNIHNFLKKNTFFIF